MVIFKIKNVKCVDVDIANSSFLSSDGGIRKVGWGGERWVRNSLQLQIKQRYISFLPQVDSASLIPCFS